MASTSLTSADRRVGGPARTSWTGAEWEGGPASPTPENVAAVMELHPVGERFLQEFTLRQVMLNAAKVVGARATAGGRDGGVCDRQARAAIGDRRDDGDRVRA
jgi:hypothetical protein